MRFGSGWVAPALSVALLGAAAAPGIVRPAGAYEARAYFNWSAGGFTVQARHRFTVAESAYGNTAVVKTTKQIYSPVEPILVDFAGFPGNSGDWITVVPKFTAEGKYAEWFWTDGKKNGRLTFKALPEGEYEVRAFFNWPAGGFVVRARHTFSTTN